MILEVYILKKGKKIVVGTIAIACFALTTVMCMQFKIAKQTDSTSIEFMKEEELREELAYWKELYKEAQEQVESKNSKLKEYKENQQSAEESEKIVNKELEQANMYMGKTDVKGEGIIIKIKDIDFDDAENIGIDPISEEDLLIIVDYLKLAGAEAISINEERIINMSDIVYVNSSIIFINQQRILAPYVIRAIGDSTKLESTLLGNGGYVELLKSIGYDITIEKSQQVEIPRYNKEIGYKYIQ